MADHPINLIIFNGNYEELCSNVSSANGLVVVVFLANWCPPCRHLGELLPNLATEFPKVTFLKTNTDEAQELVSHYGVCSIPHIKYFKAAQGNQIQELTSITGVDLPQIKAKIQQFGV